MILLFFIFFLAMPLNSSAEDVVYTDKQGHIIMDLNKIDYYMYKNQRLTFSGLCNAIIDERKSRFLNELFKVLRRN